MGIQDLDRIRNDVIREKLGVMPIKDKIKEARLRWFGHIKRSPNAPMRRCEMIDILGCKIARPKKSWNEVIRIYMIHLRLSDDMTQDGHLELLL